MARVARVDVASEEAVKGFFKKIVEDCGRVDVLVNNAGITADGLLVRMKEEDWDRILAINLKGAFLCTQAVAKTMMKQRAGCIINISSVVGAIGNPGQANYAASKAGLIGLTKSAARELAPRGITVNAVAPGFIETQMTADLPEKVKDVMLTQIPLGTHGTAKRRGRSRGFPGISRGVLHYRTGYPRQWRHVHGGIN